MASEFPPGVTHEQVYVENEERRHLMPWRKGTHSRSSRIIAFLSSQPHVAHRNREPKSHSHAVGRTTPLSLESAITSSGHSFVSARRNSDATICTCTPPMTRRSAI